ncbi:uncharacterized protein [Amphiura filiformis]|uniref:uncharacterized protein n=1 Tax=Amphiura filiformis TaxID=82378 RepID=UPI003B214F71
MDSTKFTDESGNRDTSDTKYLVFTDDTCDDQNKNYSIAALPQSPSPPSLPPAEDQYKPAGVTYIRWGRTVCPDTADLVYTGVSAGAKGSDGGNVPGGGSNYQCLTLSPQFNRSESGQQPARSRIYGAEYRSGEPGAIHDVHMYDSPCVMCQSRMARVQAFMMPATMECPSKWTREYAGYMAAARWNHPRTEYVCLDRNPETIRGTNTPDPISYFFPVEVVSSSGLPSEYETGHDLTCAICTM